MVREPRVPGAAVVVKASGGRGLTGSLSEDAGRGTGALKPAVVKVTLRQKGLVNLPGEGPEPRL